MGSQKKKKQRGQKRPFRRLQPGQFPREVRDKPLLIVNPTGHEKMSEVLEDFIEPYLGEVRNDEDHSKLLNMGIMAWNIALASRGEREEHLRPLIQAAPPDGRAVLRAFVDELIARKDAHFASNKRMILGFELTPLPTGPYLNVLSTLPAR
jgi:hypothetical protein